MTISKDEQIGRRVMSGTASNYVGKFVALSVWFLLTPFVLHHLGGANYGLWILVGSVAGYGSLLDLGISGAIVKYVAEYQAQGEPQRARTTIATVLSLYILLGAVVILLGAALAPFFPRLFNVPSQQHVLASWLVFLTFSSVGISIPCTITTAVLRGLHRFDIANLLAVGGTLLSAVSTILVLNAGKGVLGLVLAGIFLTLALQIPNIWTLKRVAPELGFGLRGGRRSFVPLVFSFSIWVAIVQVAGRIQGKTDEIVIGILLPLNTITHYSFARQLSETSRLLTDQFLKVLLPIASELAGEDDNARLQLLYITGTRLTLTLCASIGCAVVFLAQPLLVAWVGEPYGKNAYLVTVLEIAVLIDTTQWPAGSILQGMARHRPLAIMAVYSALANLGLSILLAHFIGLLGVALGTLIPTIVECLGFVLPYTARVLSISPRRIAREAFVPGLTPLVPTGLALVATMHLLHLSSLWQIAVIGILSIVVYLAIYVGIGASRFERQMYENLMVAGYRFARVYLPIPRK